MSWPRVHSKDFCEQNRRIVLLQDNQMSDLVVVLVTTEPGPKL